MVNRNNFATNKCGILRLRKVGGQGQNIEVYDNYILHYDGKTTGMYGIEVLWKNLKTQSMCLLASQKGLLC